MNKRIIITWIFLLMFTVVAGVVSNIATSYAVIAILTLSSLKFCGVAFQFMELNKAHVFWKLSLLFFLILFTILIWINFN